MTARKLSGKAFRAIFDLLFQKAWLDERSEALDELLGLCSCDSQRALLNRMLARFIYLEDTGFEDALRRFIAQVFDVWKLPKQQTQFVATTVDNEPDGAQTVLDSLR
jgi:hypothetical protein